MWCFAVSISETTFIIKFLLLVGIFIVIWVVVREYQVNYVTMCFGQSALEW